MMKTDTRKYF